MRTRPNPAALAGVGAFIAVGAIVAAACSSTASTRAGSTAAEPASPAAIKQTFVVSAAHTQLGTVLVDRAGRTLYSFSADHSSHLACSSAACLAEWPPLEVPAGTTLTAGPGLHGKLGTVMRAGGEDQVTYNGLPLYTFAGDRVAGQVGGQGLAETFGGMRGVWKAVGPGSTAAAVSAAPTTAKPVATTAAPTTSPAPAPVATQPATTLAPATTRPPVTSPPTTKAPATTQPPTTPPPTYPPTTVAGWA